MKIKSFLNDNHHFQYNVIKENTFFGNFDINMCKEGIEFLFLSIKFIFLPTVNFHITVWNFFFFINRYVKYMVMIKKKRYYDLFLFKI